MSLTSYRAAPPRGGGVFLWGVLLWGVCGPGSSPGAWLDRWRGVGSVNRAGVCRGPGVSWGFGEPGGDLLFRRLSGSTIGAEGFHGRVRDGIGCLAPRCGHQAGQTSMRPRARSARSWPNGAPDLIRGPWAGFMNVAAAKCLMGGSGAGPWWALAAARRRFSGCPRLMPGTAFGSGGFERLVPVGCADCSASTSGLSTWWSSTALDETWF